MSVCYDVLSRSIAQTCAPKNKLSGTFRSFILTLPYVKLSQKLSGSLVGLTELNLNIFNVCIRRQYHHDGLVRTLYCLIYLKNVVACWLGLYCFNGPVRNLPDTYSLCSINYMKRHNLAAIYGSVHIDSP